VAAQGLWEGVDRLLEGLEPEVACAHGLGPLAARRLRLAGEPVPDELVREERSARAGALVAPTMLARIREAYDGPLLLLKGPEVTRAYPDGARRLSDLDVLAGDAEQAQEALLAAGFRPRPLEAHPDFDQHQHLHPLLWPGVPLPVEIHRRVAWPRGLAAPRNETLFEAASASHTGVEGLLAPDPRHQAVLLASHGWREKPMRKLRQLVDVLAFTDDDAREELAGLARSWGFERGWSATLAAADWLLRDGQEPKFVRYWARYMRELQEPTVLQVHVQAWLSPFSLAPPSVATRLAAAAVLRDLRPRTEEGWGAQARKIGRALRHPLSPNSERIRRSIEGR
jgi:Uncharacterised nucleotidyltransferase